MHSQGTNELYDLTVDPQEKDNLIDKEIPAKQELAAWLARKYETMVAEPLTTSSTGMAVEKEYVEQLRALGYIAQ